MAPLWCLWSLQGTKSLLTQATTQWDKPIFFFLKTLNRRTSVSSVSAVAFHSILMKKKALWWLQEKWHRTLRKLKNFGNWYVRYFVLIIKGYLIESKGFYNCSIILIHKFVLSINGKFSFSPALKCTFIYSVTILGYGFLRLEDSVTD